MRFALLQATLKLVTQGFNTRAVRHPLRNCIGVAMPVALVVLPDFAGSTTLAFPQKLPDALPQMV